MVRVLLLHVDINIIILSFRYLGRNGDTVLIPNLKFETKSERKYRETIYKFNLIQDSLKGIYLWQSWIGYPNIHNL